MTGITADPTLITALARRIDHTATMLSSGVDHCAAAVFTLPQASRFVTALASARDRHTAAAQDLTRFYRDASTALTDFGRILTEGEDAAAQNLEVLNGTLR